MSLLDVLSLLVFAYLAAMNLVFIWLICDECQKGIDCLTVVDNVIMRLFEHRILFLLCIPIALNAIGLRTMLRW